MADVLAAIDLSKPMGKIRFLAIKVIHSPDFELVVIVLILANCVSLAMLRPMEGEDSPWNSMLDQVELGLNACFTLEVLLRIIASGGVKVRCRPCNHSDVQGVAMRSVPAGKES